MIKRSEPTQGILRRRPGSSPRQRPDPCCWRAAARALTAAIAAMPTRQVQSTTLMTHLRRFIAHRPQKTLDSVVTAISIMYLRRVSLPAEEPRPRLMIAPPAAHSTDADRVLSGSVRCQPGRGRETDAPVRCSRDGRTQRPGLTPDRRFRRVSNTVPRDGHARWGGKSALGSGPRCRVDRLLGAPGRAARRRRVVPAGSYPGPA